MKKTGYFWGFVATGFLLLFSGNKVEAGSVFTSPYVGIAPDGKAWTTNQGLSEYDMKEIPDFWYKPEEVDFRTGIYSALRQPRQGEHYYQYNRSGFMPVGQWKVAYENPRCVQGDDLQVPEQGYHGLLTGTYRCRQPYFSGWLAYCADCLEPVGRLIYMSEEAAHTITEIPLGMDYYYLCPNCSHLEQGTTVTHSCRSISYNRYKVKYDKNANDAAGYMVDSLHMYNNADAFEGSSVTPARELSLNRYFRTGYQFQGWNTEPDGTGTFFADGEEIYNLTDENYDGAGIRGVVTLYAQWKHVESTLVIDAGDGSYNGENPVCRAYGEYFALKDDLITPPSGYKVSFQTSGGKNIAPLTDVCTFERWEMSAPACGLLTGNSYQFLGDMDDTDRVTAVYAYGPVTLPVPERENLSFGGWYLDEGLTKLVGFGGESYVPTRDVTLYAKWVELRLYSADNYDAWEGKGAVDLRWEQPDNIGKTYMLYQSADGGAEYARISAISACADVGTGLDRKFAFEEKDGKPVNQTIIIPSTGFYTLTADGAQGGDYKTYKGGLGGRVSGKFYLYEGEKLTLTVGGQNGVNGGGAGMPYGYGGGMTRISSSLKGVLLTAGGGGGASAAGDGWPGGGGVGFVPEGGVGESGMSGGGGGHMGGMAGEHILHHHINDCYSRYDEDYLARGKTTVTESVVEVEYDAQGDIFEWKWNSTPEDIDHTDMYNNFCSSQIKTDGLKGMYAEFYWKNSWGEQILSKTMLTIKDQNGRVLESRTAEQLLSAPTFDNGASVADLERLCRDFEINGPHENWVGSFSNFTFSSLTTDFIFHVTPTEDSQEMYYFTVYPVTDGSRNWVHVELTDLETGRVYSNEDGAPYRQEGALSKLTVWREGYADDGYDVWNTSSCKKDMVMRVGCEFDESVQAVTVEASAVYDKDNAGHHNEFLQSIVMQVNKISCGMEEGQCVSAKPAYGGSSYINEDYAITQLSKAGCVSGNGGVTVKAVEIGLTESHELKGVKASDITAPFAIERSGISKSAKDSSCVLVTFLPVEDRGTEYYFKAESYSIRTGEVVCVSNIAKNTLMTGLRGYLYLIDQDPATVLTGFNATNALEPLTEEELEVELKNYTQYLHLAAIDKAGNVSDTVHIELSLNDPAIFWLPYTEDVLIDSTVGGRDYQNVYPGENDRLYYVKADGVTPFLLSFDSFLDGRARENYQINHQVFDIRHIDGTEVNQRYHTKLPYSVPPDLDGFMSGDVLERQVNGQFILQDAMYIGADRSNLARNINFYQAFTLDSMWDGQTITVTPVAGASTGDGILYSAWDRDVTHALKLTADGVGPVITGLEAFQSIELINRNQGSVVVEVEAFDELSGIRDFYLQIENLDNFGTAVYTADENGGIQVEITKEDPLFNGDFVVTAYAVDNVGNEAKERWYVTEFALETEVERILAPHEPVFKRGESGILSVTAWGYVDRIEIEFPDFLSKYSQTIDYNGYADYKEDETVQFMIPLYTDEGIDYEITVRVYKGDRKLEAYPAIRTIQVKDSVLDEIRTRLRG